MVWTKELGVIISKYINDAIALHSMVYDENGHPISYRFEDVNDAFLRILQLNREEVIGKCVTDIFPGIENDSFNWIGKYNTVATTQEKLDFDQYFPTTERWYSVQAVSYEKGTFICIFTDITDYKNTLEEKNLFFDNSRDFLCILAFDGSFLHMNNMWQEQLGWTSKELYKQKITSFVHPDDKESTITTARGLLTDDNIETLTNRFLCQNGSFRWLQWKVVVIKERKVVFCIARDITEAITQEQELRESEQRYHALFDNQHTPMLVVNPDTYRIIDSNPAAEAYYGYSHQEITSMYITDISIRPIDQINKEMDKAKAQNTNHFITSHILANGELHPVEVHTGPIIIHGKLFLYSIIHDITERVKNENDLRKINRILTVISNVNQLIIRESNINKIFDSLCRIAVDDGKFRMVWIGCLDEENNNVNPISYYGEESGYLSIIQISMRDPLKSNGPTGTALREGLYTVCNDIENDPRMAPWKEHALVRGYRSSASFPIRSQKRIYGIINFYSSEIDFFDEKEISFLQELSSDVSFAISFIESEKSKSIAEKRLSDANQLNLQIVTDITEGIIVYDTNLNIALWNPYMEKITGISARQAYGKSFIEIFPSYPNILHDLTNCLRGYQLDYDDLHFEIQNVDNEGWISSHITPLRTTSGMIIGVLQTISDTTSRKKAEISLRETSEFLEKLLHSARAPIVVWDSQQFITHFNSAFCHLTGYGVEEVYGKHLSLLFPDYGQLDVLGAIERIAAGENWDTLEIPILCKDKSIRTLLCNSANVYATNTKNIISTIVQGQDITERKVIEENLRKSKEQYDILVQNLPGVVFQVLANSSGFIKYLYVSSICYEINGYPAEEIINNPQLLNDLVHPLDKDSFRVYVLNAYPFTSPLSWEGRIVVKNTIKWVHIEAKPEVRSDNTILWTGVEIDITDKKTSEEALLDMESRWRFAVDNIRAGIWDWNIIDDNIYFSQRCKQIIGIDDDYNQNLDSYLANVHEEDKERVYDAINEHIAGLTETFICEYRILLGESIIIWTLNRGKIIRYNDDGKPSRMIGLQIDITERKLTESRLLQAKEAAEAANIAKNHFLANLSHEIRTPLNGIIGLTDLLLNTDLSPLQKLYLDNVSNSATSLLGIISDILDFSKIEANKYELEIISTMLSSITDKIVHTNVPKSIKKGIELLYQLDPTLAPAYLCDSLKLKQALDNLLSNAIKFTNEGYVLFSVTRTKEYVDDIGDTHHKLVFAIIDTGIGIEKGKQELIFESFTQADTSTTRQYGGTGLGLTITKRLIKLMGGNLSVESEIGKGSKFLIELDLTVDSSVKANQKPNTLPYKHVLVVDDNEINVMILKGMLQYWSIRSDCAFSADEALTKLKEKAHTEDFYDALLIDYQMPEKDGLALVETIRKEIKFPVEPIILMLSSMDLSNSLEKCKQYQIDHYLTKPVTMKELYSTLHRIASNNVENVEKPSKTSDSYLTGFMRVLVVEDNEINLLLIVEIMRKLGFHVLEATDGQEAVQIYNQNKLDMIIMDLHMPVMDGYEACRIIRESEKKKRHIPIIALTADAMIGTQERCLDAGMDAFITKPFRKEKLIEIITKLNIKKHSPL